MLSEVSVDDRPMPGQRCWIYFIRCNEFVKIGRALNVYARLYAFQVASPYELDLLGVIEGTAATEAEIHRRFARHWVRGEWFQMHDGEFLDYLKSVADAFDSHDPAHNIRFAPGAHEELAKAMERVN